MAEMNTIEVQCERCQKRFFARALTPIISNHPLLTQMIWVHESGDVCPSCHTLHVPQLAGVDEKDETKFLWVWKAMGAPKEVQQRSRIIVPPPGVLLK